MKSFKVVAIGVISIVLIAGIAPPASASATFTTFEHAVTSSLAFETTPTVGNDGTSDLIVYTSREPLDTGGYGPGNILYQRITGSGEPMFSPVYVTSGPTDDRLNDVSGEFIIYTAFDSAASFGGCINLFQIPTGLTQSLACETVAQEPRINGDNVVWVLGSYTTSTAFYYNLTWLGTSIQPVALGGPTPAASQVGVGDQYAVWVEAVGGATDVVAYDHQTGSRWTVTNTVGINEYDPETGGPWVVWQARDAGSSTTRVSMVNMDTGEFVMVADNDAFNRHPTISGDWVAYESNIDGDFNVYLYHIPSATTFQVTQDTNDQYLNDVFNNFVAYVEYDNGTANQDIFVSKFSYSLDPDMEVSPPSYDFGDVPVGTTSTAIFDIQNLGEGDLDVHSAIVGTNFLINFNMTPSVPLPHTLAYLESMSLMVDYTPDDLGPDYGEVLIFSNDTNPSYYRLVEMFGNGVSDEPPPDEQIEGILDNFDEWRSDGSIIGDGQGNSSDHRADALRNMIEAAGDLIADGLYEEACQQLESLLKKCDGNSKPPDFIAGPDASSLAQMIVDLMTSLGCQ